jgi:hypothetical protein
VLGYSILVLIRIKEKPFTGFTPPEFIDEPFAYQIVELKSKLIPLQERNNSLASDFPPELIIPTGVYSINGKRVKLENEGVFRYIDYKKGISYQKIIYVKNFEYLLHSVCWIAVHGGQDEGLDLDEYDVVCQTRYLSLKCNKISQFLMKLFEKLNIRSRIVTTLTLDTWNHYDNGHTILEIYNPTLKKWMIMDPDFNSIYLYENKHISVLDFINLKEKKLFDKIQVKKLSTSPNYDISPDEDYKFNFSFHLDWLYLGLENRKYWFDIILIQADDGFFYYYGSSSKPNLYAPNYIKLKKEDWIKKFYP